MKNFLHFIFIFITVHIIAFTVVFTVNSYAASTVVGTALYNSFQIASEYYVARAGRNIINGNEISTDISGISGINSGTYDPTYGGILKDTSVTIDPNYIIEQSKNVNLSEMDPAEALVFAQILTNDPNANNGSYIYKAFTMGGITLYYALNELGEWVGNSYDNIIAKFDTMTPARIDSITDNIDLNYPASTDYLYGSDFKFYNGSIYYEMHFTNNVFVACGSGNDSGRVFVLSPTSTISATGHWYVNGVLHDITDAYISNQFAPTGTITTDNLDFYYGALEFQFDYGSHNYVYTTNTFGNINDLISNFSASLVNDVYNSELVDSSGVPYVVPDLDGYGATIGDIYPVIDSLREAIISIPDVGDIASALTGALEGTIEDILEGIKALAISVPDVIEDEPDPEPNPYPDELPIGYWPSFIPDLVPDDMFSMFKPIFDIVGTDYSMYDIWMLIPAIMIFLFILYAIVSLL